MSTPPANGRFLRDVLIVAGQELAESIRTKRAILLLILFGGCTVLGTVLFTTALINVEKEFVTVIGLEQGAPGGATTALWKSKNFQNILVGMVGDRDLALALLRFTPIGLFYGWLMLLLVPWLVAMTSSSRIAEEIWSGSARFVLCRTTRLAWLFGKHVGQSLLLFVALLLTIAAAWATGYLKLDSFDGAATFRDMLLFAPKAWVYGLAYLALVGGISACCRSPGIANVLGLAGLLLSQALYGIARHQAGEGWRRVLDAGLNILPQHFCFELMRPEWSRALPAAVFLFALGCGYLLLGYARLARRDV